MRPRLPQANDAAAFPLALSTNPAGPAVCSTNPFKDSHAILAAYSGNELDKENTDIADSFCK